jgi:hypothetical protein
MVEIPRSLGWLAVVWILLATLSLLRILDFHVDVGWGPVNISLMGLLFGPGLLMARPWARRALIYLSWIGVVFEALGVIAVVPLNPREFRIRLAVIVVGVSLLLVQVHVLRRREVRVFFGSVVETH